MALCSVLFGDFLAKHVEIRGCDIITEPETNSTYWTNEILKGRLDLGKYRMIYFMVGSSSCFHPCSSPKVIACNMKQLFIFLAKRYRRAKIMCAEIPPIPGDMAADLKRKKVNQYLRCLLREHQIKHICKHFDHDYIDELYYEDGIHFSHHGEELVSMVLNRDILKWQRGTIAFWKVDREFEFLSNGYPCSFSIDGYEFSSVEQYYNMRTKKLDSVPADCPPLQEYIYETTDYDHLDVFIRVVPGWHEHSWQEQTKVAIVLRGLMAKFEQDMGLRIKLVATKDRRLAYANPDAPFWGCGFGPWDNRCTIPELQRGYNFLGLLLEFVRHHFKKEERSRETEQYYTKDYVRSKIHQARLEQLAYDAVEYPRERWNNEEDFVQRN